jgi:hypothetical protein
VFVAGDAAHLFGGADTGLVACATILPPDLPPGRTAGRVLIDPRGRVARDFGARPGTACPSPSELSSAG